MKTFLKISFRLLATLLCLALLIVSLPQALLAQAGEILGGYDPEPAAEEETGTKICGISIPAKGKDPYEL